MTAELENAAAPAAKAPTLADPVSQPQAAAAVATAPASGQPQAEAKPAATAIPCRPYTLPSGISEQAKTIYEKIKPILDTTPEHMNNAIGETPFCLSSEGNNKRIDTRIIYAFSEFLQESVKADPGSAGEVFKRMLALKIFLKHGDHFLFASALPLSPCMHICWFTDTRGRRTVR